MNANRCVVTILAMTLDVIIQARRGEDFWEDIFLLGRIPVACIDIF